MSREKMKILGFYLLAVLIIGRVVITPLQQSLREKKSILKEYEDTYKMRMISFEKYKAAQETVYIQSALMPISCKHYPFPQ
ncbi:MAG: hypothetical protein HQL08_00830 [Nitrospirae bacterium]|nr:hypothetical protein [Nitrospirota bacterium]